MTTQRECDCIDWSQNIPILDMNICMNALRTNSIGYQGKFFVFCPWCGKKLTEVKE